MANAKFALGDLVKSKAGTMKMVVDALVNTGSHPETRYYCVWWVGQKMHRELLTESGLEPWVDPAPPAQSK